MVLKAYKVNDVDKIFIDDSGGSSGGTISWSQSTPWATIQAEIPAGGAIIWLVDDGSANQWVLNTASGDLRNVWFIGAQGAYNPAALYIRAGWSTTGSALRFSDIELIADTATLATGTSSTPFVLTATTCALYTLGSVPLLAVAAGGNARIAGDDDTAILANAGFPSVTIGQGGELDVILFSQSNIAASAIALAAGATAATAKLQVDATCEVQATAFGAGIAVTPTIEGNAAYEPYTPATPWSPTDPTNVAQALDLLHAGGAGGITIGEPVSGAAANEILFTDASTDLGVDTNFLYDSVAHQLILGAAPAQVVRARVSDGVIVANTFVRLSTATAGRVVQWLATDSPYLLMGVALGAAGGAAVALRVLEVKGQTVSVKTDGVSAIAEGAPVFLSTTLDGRITGPGASAGLQVAVAEANDAGGTADALVAIHF